MDPDETNEARISARLEIVEALIWASAHADEVVRISRSSLNGRESLTLTEPPHSFSEFAAHHILDNAVPSVVPGERRAPDGGGGAAAAW